MESKPWYNNDTSGKNMAPRVFKLYLFFRKGETLLQELTEFTLQQWCNFKLSLLHVRLD